MISNRKSIDGENVNFNVDCVHAGGMADSVVEINDKERNLDMLNSVPHSTNQIQNQILLKMSDQLKKN